MQLSCMYANCNSHVCMQTAEHVLDVQGYGVELPVHRPPHVPTGRASAGLGSDQVSITAFHLSLIITPPSAFP